MYEYLLLSAVDDGVRPVRVSVFRCVRVLSWNYFVLRTMYFAFTHSCTRIPAGASAHVLNPSMCCCCLCCCGFHLRVRIYIMVIFTPGPGIGVTYTAAQQ